MLPKYELLIAVAWQNCNQFPSENKKPLAIRKRYVKIDGCAKIFDIKEKRKRNKDNEERGNQKYCHYCPC